MQTNTKRLAIASGLPEGDLLTGGAVNSAAYKLRVLFKEIGIDFPAPFIAWQHGLNDKEVASLQRLLASNGNKADVGLLAKAEQTYNSMAKGVIKQAA